MGKKICLIKIWLGGPPKFQILVMLHVINNISTNEIHGKIFNTSPGESCTEGFNLDVVTGCTRNSIESDILFKSVQRTYKSFSLKEVPYALPKKISSDFQGEAEGAKSFIIVELYMLQ